MVPTTDLYVNPGDESIRLGPLSVRFLLTGDHSGGSVAAFEVLVPAGQRLMAPAHSHDHYEETIYGVAGVCTWTVNGNPSTSALDRRSASHGEPFTGSTTTEARMHGHSV